MSTPTPQVANAAVVVGVGARQGIGSALCRRFAAAGLHVYAAGRTAGKLETVVEDIREQNGAATPVAMDTTQPEQVRALFEQVAGDGRVPELVVYNVGNAMAGRFLTMTPEFVEEAWRLGCFGGFLVGQEAIRRMRPQNQGTLIFTGASASLRGKPLFGAFAAAKAGLRAFAQAMAREFGPQGIHVAHVVIDGVVDGDKVNQFGWGLGSAYRMSKGSDGSLDPEAIAESYWQLHRQPRCAWTQELDLRPFKEKF